MVISRWYYYWCGCYEDIRIVSVFLRVPNEKQHRTKHSVIKSIKEMDRQ